MPKPKPDNIVRHELVLGRAERELLDTATTAYTANRVLSPLTEVLSSNAGLLLVSTVLLGYLERYLPENWPDMDDNQLADWFETSNIVFTGVGAGVGGVIGAFFGLPILGAGIGAVGGFAGAEVGEAAWENPSYGASGGLGPFGQIVAAARILDLTIQRLQE